MASIISGRRMSRESIPGFDVEYDHQFMRFEYRPADLAHLSRTYVSNFRGHPDFNNFIRQWEYAQSCIGKMPDKSRPIVSEDKLINKELLLLTGV